MLLSISPTPTQKQYTTGCAPRCCEPLGRRALRCAPLVAAAVAAVERCDHWDRVVRWRSVNGGEHELAVFGYIPLYIYIVETVIAYLNLDARERIHV